MFARTTTAPPACHRRAVDQQSPTPDPTAAPFALLFKKITRAEACRKQAALQIFASANPAIKIVLENESIS